jgi:hypothetical protein
MAQGARGALVLGDGAPRVEHLTSAVTLRAGRFAHAVEGINRYPGVIEDCGRPGARPVAAPRQDVTCTSSHELVLLTAQLGAPAPAGPGAQAVIGRRGTVWSVGPRRGGTVPPGGMIVQGIGAPGGWLRRHLRAGQHVRVTERVASRSGRRVPLRPGVSAVSAAPVLLLRGRPAIDAAAEGVVDPADLSFNFAWAQDRQPRTMAGVSRTGQLILVTVDGRQPGRSEGATLTEAAALMRSLGAVSAVNLDGGGSTAMAVRGALADVPSGGAQRADGDAVLVVPAAK